ncbi:MAG: 2-dehydro-3-deoxyphosphogluconate aldolase [Myxococcales bacterium 68-20]|nr:bifunctional 4-hydroxy-2-oxoglutarate aldolase/2-dehydro-3-deoxy-phosphogluconate aldolase [Myxococcales bacterium]OJY17144.1 MAG: 2-dehydro-3-deoxyphosphogluconate aldolase [Myxococcales bacterium 68-20]
MIPRSRLDSLRTIERERALAVVRLEDAAPLLPVVEALAAGGVHIVEITVTIPGALEAMAPLGAKLGPRVLIGAGSVLDAETARLAILAGARFVVGPTFRPAVVELCHRYDVLAIPGAYTPTEILSALEAGADLVKVFPAVALGPAYVRNVLGPLPHLRLLPTGGVTTENAAEFLDAGAVAVGVGGALLDGEALARGDYPRVTEAARRLTSAISAACGRSR